MNELTGKLFDRYEIGELLGEGAMGAVYRARHISLKQDVAIKVMHAHYARQPEFRMRFLGEARTAARLEHPGIVKVRDFVATSEHTYIVMDYIPGDNLRGLLKRLASNGGQGLRGRKTRHGAANRARHPPGRPRKDLPAHPEDLA